MKIISFYLPQFHIIPENEKWWGKGYTEWTAVRKAESLFEGHNQPNIPYQEKYYDLLEKETMERQCEYMHKYGIDGMCFYHYYFKDGMKLLEKPAENLLKWADIDMPFCFAWDNSSWTRSWSKIAGNAWNTQLEIKSDNEKSILAEFSYGEEEQWKEHFYYLLQFFNDRRYIKDRNGRPIFILWNINEIDTIKRMKKCWDKLADKEGIEKISLVCNGTYVDDYISANLVQEPHHTIRYYFEHVGKRESDLPIMYDYDEIWKKLLSHPYTVKNTYLGAFVGYDDTPRRGSKGKAVLGQTPEKFEKYFAKLLTKAMLADTEFVFLNAWNEWGEGMYIEPDERNQFKYLEAVKNAKDIALSEYEWLKSSMIGCSDNLEGNSENSELKKYYNFYLFYRKWLELKMKGINISGYIKSVNVSEIAIYGIGTVGRLLIDELESDGVTIKYGIDSTVDLIEGEDFGIYKPSDELDDVELIIVALADNYDTIVENMRNKMNCKVLSLFQIIEELLVG